MAIPSTPARAPRVVPRRPLPPLVGGPFVGVRDAEDAAESSPKLARALVNLVPLDPNRGGVLIGRPGTRLAGAQEGTAGFRTGQCVGQFSKADLTEITVKIVGGRFYTFDWTTRTWSETLTAAQLTAAGVTIHPTMRVYLAVFVDQLIVSDGFHLPWAWDGTAGGGITLLTAADVAFGQPVVYDARLWFIKDSERTAVIWSEVNQPNSGYESGGFNNAWGLTQTSSEILVALQGNEEGLDVFRPHSNTTIAGTVTADFRTTHTRESGSEVVGTLSPACLVRASGLTFFLDADLQPYVRRPGAGVSPLWSDCAETVKTLSRDFIADVLGVWDPSTQMVLFAVSALSESVPRTVLAFNPAAPGGPRFVGTWIGWTVQAWGIVKNALGKPVLMHLDDAGYAYEHDALDGALLNDASAAGDVAIRHQVESTELGYDTSLEKDFVRIDLALRAGTVLSAASFQWIGPRGASTALSFALAALTGTDNPPDRKVTLGLRQAGRWGRFRVTHEVLSERFGFEKGAVQALPSADAAGVV